MKLFETNPNFRAFEFHHKIFPLGHTLEGLWYWFKISKKSKKVFAWPIGYKYDCSRTKICLFRNFQKLFLGADVHNASEWPVQSRIHANQGQGSTGFGKFKTFRIELLYRFVNLKNQASSTIEKFRNFSEFFKFTNKQKSWIWKRICNILTLLRNWRWENLEYSFRHKLSWNRNIFLC